MKHPVAKILPPLLITACSFIFNQAYAVAHPYEFHADSKMQLQSYGPVDNAYGYMYVETDTNGEHTLDLVRQPVDDAEVDPKTSLTSQSLT